MNFIDRTSLGDALALHLQQFHGKDAIILCLQEDSLLTCLTVASQIRAWLYPLIYEPVYSSDHAQRLLGAYDQDGEFCPLPDPHAPAKTTLDGLQDSDGQQKTATTDSELADSDAKAIKKQKTAAMKAINRQLSSYGITLDKRQMDGRDIILAADVLTDVLPLAVAQKLLKEVRPRSLTAVAGNATPEAAHMLRMSAGTTEIMDVLSGITYDHRRYFEHEDSYTPEQKYTLTQHIAAYWQ